MVLVGLAAILTMFGGGVRPKSLPIIKASQFHDGHEFAFWAYRQTRQKFMKYSLIVFGYEDHDQDQIDFIKSYINIAQKNGMGFDLAISQVSIEGLSVATLVTPETASGKSLVKYLRPYLENQQKVALILPLSQASRLLSESPVRYLEQQASYSLIVLSLLSYQQELMDDLKSSNACEGFMGQKLDRIELMDCFFLKKERELRKISDKSTTEEHPLTSSMEQYGGNDFILYFFRKS